MRAAPTGARRFTPARVTLFLLVGAALVAWDGYKKTPTGPAQGDQLVGNPAATQPAQNLLRIATFNINGGVGGEDNRFDLGRTIAALSAPVLQVAQHGQRAGHDVMTATAGQIGDKAHATGVVLEAGIVKSLGQRGCRRCHPYSCRLIRSRERLTNG